MNHLRVVDYLQKRGGVAYEINETNPFTGKYIIKYDNGQKKEEITYENGHLNGLFAKWNEDGQKVSEKTYKNGHLNGLFAKWNEDGQKVSEKTYKNGQKHGLSASWWYQDGTKCTQASYNNGILDGLFVWWENGSEKKLLELTFKNGLPVVSKQKIFGSAILLFLIIYFS